MEVHGRQHDNTRDQLQRAGRDRIRHARHLVDGVKDARAEAADRPSAGDPRDSIELSSIARTTVERAERDAERDSRIQRLAEALREGRLLSPERLERAAAKLLGA